MTDKFIKTVLVGILICLIIIAFKSINVNVTSQAPNVSIENDNAQQFIQIAPNRIGIVDTGRYTGYRGQLIVFDFDPATKTFSYIETLNASYILNHPEEYGIPMNSK